MKSVDVQLIRNATMKIKYKGKTILIDPMFSSKNTFMSFVEPNKNLNPILNLPIDIEDIIEDVDTILITHLHPDHLDPLAVKSLNVALPMFVQPTDISAVKEMGFVNVKAVDDAIEYDGIEIIKTYGHHGPKEIRSHLGEVSGYILSAQDYPTIYIIGDCIWEDIIQETIKKYSPDIIITNSGGAVFMGEHRILMDANETILVAEMAPKAQVIATHMEALDHCLSTRETLKRKADASKVNILIPQDGEWLSL